MSENYATDDACDSLLQRIFGDLDVLLSQIAPEGWANSSYLRVHHPSVEQRFGESITIHENLNRLFAGKKDAVPMPTREEIRKNYDEENHTVRVLEELLNVFGGCVWSVFSNNHSVTGPGGEEYDLGSFRGTGSTLAGFIEKYYPEAPAFDYVDFYCADVFIERRADVTPIYELIFRRLKAQNCDWSYTFPRIHIVNFSDTKEQPLPENSASYDPNRALSEELEKQQEKAELNKLREKLEETYRKETEEAFYKPPPMVVQAYLNVYGKWPAGWIV